MNSGEQLARQLLQSLPLMVVYLGGIAACIVCWRRGPRAAGFALGGLAILLVGYVLGNIATFWMIQGVNRDGNPDHIPAMMLTLSLLRSCGYAVGMGLLLFAVFIDREPRLFARDGN